MWLDLAIVMSCSSGGLVCGWIMHSMGGFGPLEVDRKAADGTEPKDTPSQELVQEVAVLGGELPRRPPVGHGGIRVEHRDVDLADGRPVMVSEDADLADLAEPGDALPRLRPVADDVSQTPYLVYPTPALDVIQHRGKGGQVGMDISKNGATHIVSDSGFPLGL